MKRNMLSDIELLKDILAPIGVIMAHLPGFNPNHNTDGWIWELINLEKNLWKRIK